LVQMTDGGPACWTRQCAIDQCTTDGRGAQQSLFTSIQTQGCNRSQWLIGRTFQWHCRGQAPKKQQQHFAKLWGSLTDYGSLLFFLQSVNSRISAENCSCDGPSKSAANALSISRRAVGSSSANLVTLLFSVFFLIQILSCAQLVNSSVSN